MNEALEGDQQHNQAHEEVSDANQVPLDLTIEKGNSTMFNFNNSVCSGKSRQTKKGTLLI